MLVNGLMGYVGQLKLGVRHTAVRADFEVQTLLLWPCFPFRFDLFTICSCLGFRYQSGLSVLLSFAFPTRPHPRVW